MSSMTMRPLLLSQSSPIEPGIAVTESFEKSHIDRVLDESTDFEAHVASLADNTIVA